MTLAADLLYRAIGSAGGSAIALAIAQPRSRNGFAKHLVVSMTTGMMAAPVWLYYADWLPTRDNIIAAACVSAGLAWVGWHAGRRSLEAIIQAWNLMPKRKE